MPRKGNRKGRSPMRRGRGGMHRRVQCIHCRQILAGRHHSTIEYVYCESCCRCKLHRLEAQIALFRAAAQKASQDEKEYTLASKKAQFLSNWNHGHGNDNDHDDGHPIPLLSDVVLQPSDGPSVHAHRAILAGKSPAFKAIFCSPNMQGEPKVQTPIVINIDDMSHKVLKAFVRFFYTAAIDPEIMEKHSTSLYCAAEKYGVKLLKKLCEEWIMNNLSDQNALSNLELAKQYDSEVVKDAVFHAASLHIDKIPSYAEYQTYVEKDPGLLVELYEGTVKMMSRKRSRKGKLSYSETLSYCGPKPLYSSLQLPTDWHSLADMDGDYQASTPSRLSEDCESTGNDAHSAA